jgi:hypothetical protein
MPENSRREKHRSGKKILPIEQKVNEQKGYSFNRKKECVNRKFRSQMGER